MRHDLLIQFDDQTTVEIAVDAAQLPDPLDARRWLDEEFTRRECEPLRPSGKLLTTDKLLVLAQEIGPAGLADEALRLAFARAVLGQLQRPAVTINLQTMKVS